MNIFEELSFIYSETDNFYAANEFEARAKGFHRKESQFRRKRELNDHAYFLFMFTRLEERIREQSSRRGDKIAIITVYVPKPPKFTTPWTRRKKQ